MNIKTTQSHRVVFYLDHDYEYELKLDHNDHLTLHEVEHKDT